MTQGQLGTAIGTNGNMVGKYERDEMKPSIEAAAKIADVLGSSLDYLIRGLGPAQSGDESLQSELSVHFAKLQKLPLGDQNHIIAVIDAFMAKSKIKSITE